MDTVLNVLMWLIIATGYIFLACALGRWCKGPNMRVRKVSTRTYRKG